MRTQIDFERRLGYWQPEEVIVVVLPAFFLHRGNNLPSQKKLNFHFKSNSRNMHWIPVGASLFASNIGSEHFIGNLTNSSLQAFFCYLMRLIYRFKKSRTRWLWGSFRGGHCLLRDERNFHLDDTWMVNKGFFSSYNFDFVGMICFHCRFFVPVYLSSGIYTMPEYLRLR